MILNSLAKLGQYCEKSISNAEMGVECGNMNLGMVSELIND